MKNEREKVYKVRLWTIQMKWLILTKGSNVLNCGPDVDVDLLFINRVIICDQWKKHSTISFLNLNLMLTICSEYNENLPSSLISENLQMKYVQNNFLGNMFFMCHFTL